MAANRRRNIIITLATIQLFGALFLLAISADSSAGVYKCVDADGNITYAQTPCPNQKTTTVHTAASNAGKDALDCEHANRFALTVARSMKSGRSSSDTYMKYGGVDSMSKAAVNIVSYVHSFQHSDDISVDRIAALAGNRCQARAFGAASCESLPVSFTDSIGGCDVDDEANADAAGEPQPATAASVNASELGSARSAPTMPDASAAVAVRNEERRTACIESKRAEIDSINDAMRSGYSSAEGDRYRQRIRDLRQAIKDC